MSGVGEKIKSVKGGGAPPLASALEGPRRTPPNGGDPRNAPGDIYGLEVDAARHYLPTKNGNGGQGNLVPLLDLVERVETWNPLRSHDDTFLYIDLSAVDQETKTIIGAKEIPCKDAPSRARQIVLSGDILVSTVRPNLNGVAQVQIQYDGATASTGFCVLRSRPDLLDSRYLFNWVKSPDFIEDMVRKATGASYPAVSDRIILDSIIPLPPLPEQRRVAEVLDRVEGLRAKRRKSLQEIDNLPQAFFAEMFGAPETLFSNWPTKKVGALLDFLTSGSRGWATHYSESGSLFLRIQNVRYDEMLLEDVAYVNAPNTAEAKRTRVEPGDVLLSITADLGRTAVVPDGIGPAYISQHLSILRTKAIVPRFLSAYFASPLGQRQVSGRNKHGVKAGLNFDDIRSFEVPVPPFSLQEEFTRRIAAVERLKAAHRASLAELDALFSSLQYRAFRGEL